MMLRRLGPATLALASFVALDTPAKAQNLAIALFERYVEPLRVQAGIPGLSAAIVQDGQIVWERGFGHAEIEGALPARPDTPYNVGDLTQTFTTVLLAQCAERVLVRPDDPIRTWVPLAPDPPATLRQVLSHTSGPTGGFRYDSGRFALLTGVVESCTSQPYRRALAQRILDRVVMFESVPGRDFQIPGADGEPLFSETVLARYTAVVQRLAAPYKVDKRGRATRAEPPPPGIDASTGLIASVRDLAKFDAGLDSYVLVRADILTQTWINATSANGVSTPTTLGWFSQIFQRERLVWHFGLVPDAYSGLILKIPSRRLTLILLANSDGLSAPFSLQSGDVTSSLFARTFLRLFL
jgi:CubicO group peptidase (beta-lactamase class C family)